MFAPVAEEPMVTPSKDGRSQGLNVESAETPHAIQPNTIGKADADVCVCGTAFPDKFSKFCRKCGAKRPESQDEVTGKVDWKIYGEQADILWNIYEEPQYAFPPWSKDRLASGELEECARTTVVYYSKEDDLRKVQRLATEREPVNLAMERCYKVAELKSNYGYEHGAYSLSTEDMLMPNIAIYTKTPLTDGKQFASFHVVNAVGIAFDTPQQPDYRYFFKKDDVSKKIAGMSSEKWEELVQRMSLMWRYIFECAKQHSLKHVYLASVGGSFFKGPLTDSQYEELKQLSLSPVLASYPGIEWHPLPKIPDWCFSEEGKKRCDDSLLVNAWDPWSMVGNGNGADDSLDGYYGRCSALAVLCWPRTNPLLQYISIDPSPTKEEPSKVAAKRLPVVCTCGTIFPADCSMFCRICGAKRPEPQEEAVKLPPVKDPELDKNALRGNTWPARDEANEEGKPSELIVAPVPQKMSSAAPWEEEMSRVLADYGHGHSATANTKVLYFVRHAESMSNVYNRRIKKGCCCAICQLACIGFDAPLSKQGYQQLLSVRDDCQSLLPELQAVFHSPLSRTENTAKACFGAADDSTPGKFTSGSTQAVPWIPLAVLKEEMFSEHMEEPGYNCCAGHRVQRKGVAHTKSVQFRRRIQQFVIFAWQCPWTCMAVVGHSLFFRCLMGIFAPESGTVCIKNAAVWKLTLGAPQNADGIPSITQWNEQISPAAQSKPLKS